MADALELEESELFDHQDDIGQHKSGALEDGAALPSPATIFPDDTLGDEAVDDDDDEEDDEALDLELDSDSPASGSLANQMASLQSSAGRSDPMSMEAAIRTAELRSGDGPDSRVGSLRRPESTGSLLSRRFAAAEAGEQQLYGVAASLPVRSHMMNASMFRTSFQDGAAQADDCAHLGTSMPIRIPLMQRRGLAASPAGADGRTAFVPPHLMESYADGSAIGGDGAAAGSLRESPRAAVRREKLIARNAILRSTGFIEVQQSAFAPRGVGEVLDAVKDALTPTAPLPAGGFQRRPTAPSSLTALLSSSH